LARPSIGRTTPKQTLGKDKVLGGAQKPPSLTTKGPRIGLLLRESRIETLSKGYSNLSVQNPETLRANPSKGKLFRLHQKWNGLGGAIGFKKRRAVIWAFRRGTLVSSSLKQNVAEKKRGKRVKPAVAGERSVSYSLGLIVCRSDSTSRKKLNPKYREGKKAYAGRGSITPKQFRIEKEVLLAKGNLSGTNIRESSSVGMWNKFAGKAQQKKKQHL